MKKRFVIPVLILLSTGITGLALAWQLGYIHTSHQPQIGEAIDSLNHVKVYYNGAVSHVGGRNLSKDGYNLGLKYQCVEFVKRYYFEYLNHRMPDSYGHAKDFFDPGLPDKSWNKKRGLQQFRNPGSGVPEVNDIVIFDGNLFNPYGHVAIVSAVHQDAIEIIQQNGGPRAASRVLIPMEKTSESIRLLQDDILGWLHKKPKE